MPPIFVITGPPAAGKTTVSTALLQRYEFGIQLHVDDLRTWVVSGLSESINWTDETERQFQIAEEASCDIALRYWRQGFAVAFDHCRNIPRLEALINERFTEVEERGELAKVCLLPSLEVNLERNHNRTTKDFDPKVLDFIIEGMNPSMRATDIPHSWHVLDTSSMTVDETLDAIQERLSIPP